MAEPLTKHAKACFYGLVAVSMVCATSTAASLPVEPPPQHWTRQAAGSLLAYIERVGSHGLEPADYNLEELRQAIRSGDDGELEHRASDSFGRLARDLAGGHVPSSQRRQFHMASVSLEPVRIAALIDRALASESPSGVLDDLAPRDPQYGALRAALADLSEGQETQRHKIEASLERWRWMPRQTGGRHLVVNIPEYRLHVMADGRETASHRVIVGKPRTPTPQFAAQVTGVILNPTWSVPQSIIAESVGSLVRNNPGTARARGYTWSYATGKLRVTQQPGPGNALGQLKLDMPNPFTVYLHDTPSRELFGREERALSHGCIRTDKPFELAARLLAGTDWNSAKIADVVASKRTTRVPLEQQIPVYMVYMTAFAAPDGTVNYFADPYGLDAGVNRLLDDRTGD